MAELNGLPLNNNNTTTTTAPDQLQSREFRSIGLGLRNIPKLNYFNMNNTGMDDDFMDGAPEAGATKKVRGTAKATTGGKKRKSTGETEEQAVKRPKTTTGKKLNTPKKIASQKSKRKEEQDEQNVPTKKKAPPRRQSKPKAATRTSTRATRSKAKLDTDVIDSNDGDDELSENQANAHIVGDVAEAVNPLSTPKGPVESYFPGQEIPSSPLSSVPSEFDEPSPLDISKPTDHAKEESTMDMTSNRPEVTNTTAEPFEHDASRENPTDSAHKLLVTEPSPGQNLMTGVQAPAPFPPQTTPFRARRQTKTIVRYGSYVEPPAEPFEENDIVYEQPALEGGDDDGMDLDEEEFEDLEGQDQEDEYEHSYLPGASYRPGAKKSRKSSTNPRRSGKKKIEDIADAVPIASPDVFQTPPIPNEIPGTESVEPVEGTVLEQETQEATSKSTAIRKPRLDSIHNPAKSRVQSTLIRLPVGVDSSQKRLGLSPATQRGQNKSVGTTTTPAAKKTLPTQPTQAFGLASPASTQSDEAYEAIASDGSVPDSKMVLLAEKMTRRDPVALKSYAQGEPLVWADSRQALCETVPYFRMPQSGCHQNDRHVYAFLFDGVGHCREYMDSDVIISRAGGGMEPDSTGQMVQKKDHLMSESQVLSVLNDIEHQNPLVIICGNKNEGSPVKMPHRYNVLGWYKPVAVWAEKTVGKGKKTWTTIKYRFERLNSSFSIWHSPTEPLLSDEEKQSAGPLTSQTCSQCQHHYPMVYLVGWMCLNPDCHQFWKLSDGKDAPFGKLHYNPAFLLSRTPWGSEEEPYSVRPPVLDVGKVVGDNLTHINTRGICCPECGRCSSRRLFRGWKCDNPNCDFQNFPKHMPVKVPMLHQPWEGTGEGPTLARNKHEKAQGVNVSVSHILGFKVYTYTFDGVNGKFVHAVSNSKINRQKGGPDEMFAAMQNQDDPNMDLHLERRRFAIERGAGSKSVDAPVQTPARRQTAPHALPTPPESSLAQKNQGMLRAFSLGGPAAAFNEEQANALRQPGSLDSTAEWQPFKDGPADADYEPTTQKTPGRPSAKSQPVVEDGDMMTAFSMNYGMPYKFVASGASLPFTDSPWPIQTCRADLNWASQNFLDPQGHTDLNELLIFAYMEGQKIEYHDDGESGLGPRIATLSLGGKAQMHMRMKMKHYVGCSKTGIFTAERPVPGSIDGKDMYEKRLAAWEELQTLKETNKPAYEKRRKELPKELGLFEKRTKKASDLVTITLNHGDIALMEGYEIQQYMEHKVVPEGVLRFALTCRTVLPDHLRPEERPDYEVEEDDGGMSVLRKMAEAETAGLSEA